LSNIIIFEILGRYNKLTAIFCTYILLTKGKSCYQ